MRIAIASYYPPKKHPASDRRKRGVEMCSREAYYLMVTDNVGTLFDEGRYDHKQQGRYGTNADKQPEEARTVKLCKESTAFNVVLDHRYNHVANRYAQEVTSHNS